jgi:hypothetical protein
MPAGFPARLGGIGTVDAVAQHTADPTAPLHRRKLLAWVSSLEYCELFAIEGEEEWFPYTSQWLRSRLDRDASLSHDWAAFSARCPTPAHRYQAAAFVSWYLSKRLGRTQSTIVDVIAGVQWSHTEIDVFAVMTESEVYIIVGNETLVVPRSSIKCVSMRQGKYEGRMLFSGDSSDVNAFGIDKLPNESALRWYKHLDRSHLQPKEGSIEVIAARDLADAWPDWRNALDALETGLGSQDLTLDLEDDPLFIPAEIGSARWNPSREQYTVALSEGILPTLDIKHLPLIIEAFFREQQITVVADDETSPSPNRNPGNDRTIHVFRDGIPFPLSEGSPVLWRNPESEGPFWGEPWDRLAEKREALIAVSNGGIWRVPKNGSCIYFNPWSNIAGVTVFTEKASISIESVDVHLFAGPQNEYQLSEWDSEDRLRLRALFSKNPKFSLSLFTSHLNAEWLRIDPKYATALRRRVNQNLRTGNCPSEDEISERVAMHENLDAIGMGWCLLPIFSDKSWVVPDFDCLGCGRLASTIDAIKIRREQLAILQSNLGDEVFIIDLAYWYIEQREEEVRVLPATVQRQFQLSYEQSVRLLSLFEDLDLVSPTKCKHCVERRLQKTGSGGGNERMGLPTTVRFQVLQASGFRCHYCGRGPNSTPPVELEVDHIVPVAAGGTNDRGNLQAACRDCNRGKSATEIL